MSYQVNKLDTETIVSRQKNSGTQDQSNTSSVISTNYVVGAMQEVVFNTLCTNISGTAATGWAGSGTPNGTSAQSPFLSVDSSPFQNNNTFLTFTTPNNLNTGLYKLTYKLGFANTTPKVDISVTIAGGAPVTLRSQLDTFINFGTLSYVSMEDYFYVNNNNSSCVIKWLANGKNASSTAYSIFIADNLRIYLMG